MNAVARRPPRRQNVGQPHGSPGNPTRGVRNTHPRGEYTPGCCARTTFSCTPVSLRLLLRCHLFRAVTVPEGGSYAQIPRARDSCSDARRGCGRDCAVRATHPSRPAGVGVCDSDPAAGSGGGHTRGRTGSRRFDAAEPARYRQNLYAGTDLEWLRSRRLVSRRSSPDARHRGEGSCPRNSRLWTVPHAQRQGPSGKRQRLWPAGRILHPADARFPERLEKERGAAEGQYERHDRDRESDDGR